jgi:trimethylamine:corrinoid methyltransferase-like protein
LALPSAGLDAGWNQMAGEVFKQTDKHIHLRAFNGETLKLMFEMATIVPGGKDQLKEHPEEPDLIGMSALLTTIMLSMKATIEALTEAGLDDNVKVIVGGAPVTAKLRNSLRDVLSEKFSYSLNLLERAVIV